MDTLGFVKYMHIKDKIKDGEIVPAGEGDGNILKLISLFKQIGDRCLRLNRISRTSWGSRISKSAT